MSKFTQPGSPKMKKFLFKWGFTIWRGGWMAPFWMTNLKADQVFREAVKRA